MNPLVILRDLHILAAAVLIGGAVFNYFLLRPALRLIPAAHAVVIGQHVGTYFTWVGWGSLVLLGLTGTVRMLYIGNLSSLIMPEYYAAPPGRAVGLMILAWLVAVGSATWMTLMLRPVLMSKLTVNSNPDLAAVEKRRNAQMAASKWLDRLQLVNVIFSSIAAIAGGAASYGGLF